MTTTTVIMVGATAAEDMMIGMPIMRVGAGGIGAQALAIGGEEAEVQVGEKIEALSEMAVKSVVPELSNGIGKRKNLKEPRLRLMLVIRMMSIITMEPHTMESRTMDTSSHSSSRKAMDIDNF
uniref:Uncharacterized protein n=1 Tax=Opuntia streptacantha TaxID=393608 RepID=A0A7C8ZQ96_OPUST